jgi:hypothetical protein
MTMRDAIEKGDALYVKGLLRSALKAYTARGM